KLSILYNSRSTLGGLVSRLNYATKPTEVDSKHTPIIPEVGRSVDIENTGRGELTIQYQWGAPFMAGGWKVAKSHVVQRDETYHLQRPDNAFYHQRIVVINNGASRGFCTIYYH
ncbi:hypothetical protein P5E46_24510, partial [Vibrio parahaemolyticus]|nr:hypothetical protein [Vibrio parahaemolyticus]